MQVERRVLLHFEDKELSLVCNRITSGKRVSNTLVTYLEDGDSSAKAGLIPDGNAGTQVIRI